MDVIRNPYSPGAGTRPPELAGRDELLERVRVSIERIRIGRPARSLIMVGLRGVGKTVLLNQMQRDAEAAGIHTVYIEAFEHRSLPAILAPQLRVALIRLSRIEAAEDAAITGLRALAGFASALNVKFGDIKVGVDYEPETGLADNSDLEDGLAALLVQLGKVAKAAGTCLVIFVDELQYVAEEQLAALINALHRTSQLALPVTLIGAGLPQLRGRAGSAKPYAKRFFDYPVVGPLEPSEARLALVKPAQDEGVTVDPEVADEVFQITLGYPYFVQVWGSSAWGVASNDHITLNDIQRASAHAIASLDESFFRVRFDRMNVAEKVYLRAMASLGEGPHRSSDIATRLDRTSQSLGPIRSSLIGKGMIWSPNHGDTAFTVPMFDQYMRRIMPGDD
ncbi:ATPase AAA [Stutzerimonas stutzeri]|uniref:ATPase AAA n=1 Tax=Stutzerimonas stutzeri TaxID=316 RepID=W8R3S9_STUST|nr:ATP-binding protein [Stutzerimonas stutzeri]AHL77565.1 ATPase AAA [Stutzerimonas stutzeri]MCQ4330469.1 ATP-binding protein [Stutzerimonas stutzeri]